MVYRHSIDNHCYLCLVFSADALGNMLATHLDEPRVYIGCMKSGEVFSEPWVLWNIEVFPTHENGLLDIVL